VERTGLQGDVEIGTTRSVASASERVDLGMWAADAKVSAFADDLIAAHHYGADQWVGADFAAAPLR
jgi:hypothetical protein